MAKQVKPSFRLRVKDFFIKNKIMSLVFFSLLGGIPGSINIYNWLTDKPKFNMYIETKTGGITFNEDSIKVSYIMFTGAVYNNGRQPLFPTNYVLNVELEDTTFKILATTPPLNLFDSTTIIKLKFRFVPHNLLEIIRVNPMDAQWGYLFFPIPYNERIFDQEAKEKIICLDITDKKWQFNIEKKTLKLGNKFYSPKTGIDAQPSN